MGLNGSILGLSFFGESLFSLLHPIQSFSTS
jgi:hypothetical protein